MIAWTRMQRLKSWLGLSPWPQEKPTLRAAAPLDVGVTCSVQLDPVVVALKKVSKPVTNNELADLLGVSPGQASKMVSARAGLIRKDKIGKEVAITLH
jgi:hypothetical protein